MAAAAPEDEREGLFEELFDPFASVRVTDFDSAIRRLREIDPNNPNLVYVAPHDLVPSQAAIDSINDAITIALAAKQPAPARPTMEEASRFLMGRPGACDRIM